MKSLIYATCAALIAGSAASEPLCNNFGFAGLLAHCNRGEQIALKLGAGVPLGEDVVLESGAYYEMLITSDGTAELALSGPGFFRAIWMDEIVINEIEIRPMAIDSIEFDDEGTLELSFVAIKPGRYELKVPGTRGDAQKINIQIQ